MKTSHEFVNELGNRIIITIEGPESIAENILTPIEVAHLEAALRAHRKMTPEEVREAAARIAQAWIERNDPDIRLLPTALRSFSIMKSEPPHAR
jgi:hypothetical protein